MNRTGGAERPGGEALPGLQRHHSAGGMRGKKRCGKPGPATLTAGGGRQGNEFGARQLAAAANFLPASTASRSAQLFTSGDQVQVVASCRLGFGREVRITDRGIAAANRAATGVAATAAAVRGDETVQHGSSPVAASGRDRVLIQLI
jgi:hypothetical protein